MKTVTVVADSAAQALNQVYQQLGPSAVIVNVRKLAQPGFSRIWKKPQVELKAALPQMPEAPKNKHAPASFLRKVQHWNKKAPGEENAEPSGPTSPKIERAAKPSNGHPADDVRRSSGPLFPAAELELTKVLENLGILPVYAQWLADQVRSLNRGHRLASLREEFMAVQGFLVQHWNQLASLRSAGQCGTKVLVGAPGVGKTTCLCKWLTQAVLVENKKACVWRLDTHTANTAEFLSIHGEILGAPVERIWANDVLLETPDVQFVDFPGVAIDDTSSISALSSQIEVMKPAQVLLVLNAAYDLPHLLAQVKAFSVLPLSGMILTHLDEEFRWSRFWNLLLGAKLPVLYLSSGQNIPGHFAVASPQTLFELEFEEGIVGGAESG